MEFLLGTGLLSSPVEAPLSGGVEFLPRTGLFSSPVEAPLGGDVEFLPVVSVQ